MREDEPARKSPFQKLLWFAALGMVLIAIVGMALVSLRAVIG